MKSLELIEVGDGLGIIFPDDLLASLQIGVGDDVHLTPTENGFSLYSSRSDSKFFFQRKSEDPSVTHQGVTA